MVTKRDFLENGSVTMTYRAIRNGIVTEGWISTLCCWEAAVHTF